MNGFNEICMKIHQYILFNLQNWLDYRIFIKSSKSELGKLYYYHVLNMVKGATQKHLDVVIKKLGKKDIPYQKSADYYLSLCDIIRIEKLPKDSLKEAKKEYFDIFENQYKRAVGKVNTEIKRIESEIDSIQSKKNTILNSPLRHRFERNLAVDEERLEKLEVKGRECESRIETLKFEQEYVEKRLMEYCDFHNNYSVNLALKKTALYLCTNTVYSAESFFCVYKNLVEAFEDDIVRPYALFFRIKTYIIAAEADKLLYLNKFNTQFNAEKEYTEFLGKCPKFDELNQMKNTDLNMYNQMLDQLIKDYNIISKIKNIIQSCVCLRKRRALLLRIVELYTQNETELFNSIVPVQIEGVFADYLKETTIFNRFSHFEMYPKAVLRDKIDYLVEKDQNMYPEAVAYYKFYFNNLIRNRIAHGKYTGNATNLVKDEVFSKELLLDLSMVIYMSSRNSESDKMYIFVHNYKDYYSKLRSGQNTNLLYRPLLNDLTKEKTIMDYDQIERYNPIKVVYWLVNPYYESIYCEVTDDNHLLQLRQVFLSKGFWEYVLEQLEKVEKSGFNYLHFNTELITIVNGLFGCNIPQATKKVLGKVHAKLKLITGWQEIDQSHLANKSKMQKNVFFVIIKKTLCVIKHLFKKSTQS